MKIYEKDPADLLSDDGYLTTVTEISGQGPRGPEGSQGPEGPEGATGNTGPVGVQGVQGDTGQEGLQGPAGQDAADPNAVLSGGAVPVLALGKDGDFYINTSNNEIFGPKTGGVWGAGVTLYGPQGDQGLKGDTGAKGDPGDQGDTGNTGAEGLQGLQGAAGETGSTGPQGERGYQGDRGVIGPQGSQGELGDKGSSGGQGLQGPAGLDAADPNTVLSGTASPASALGNNGDFYIDTDNSEIYGPKTAGIWGAGATLYGPQGTQGSRGEAGSKGDPGSKGDTGNAGAEGPQGPQGSTGEIGSQGLQGDRGYQGERGVIGPQGNKGDRGVKGDTGPAGSEGPAGQNAAEPTKVLSGFAAPASALGQDGDFYIDTDDNEIYGPKTAGLWGNSISLIGPQGPQGSTGNTGDKGDTGNPGLQGNQGDPGQEGATGLQGDIGPSAYDTWLALGNTGSEVDFNASLTGEKGDKGDPGDPGSAGNDGINGADGSDGAPGVDGINGTAGINGTNGADGTDASVTKTNVENVLTGELNTHGHTELTLGNVSKLETHSDGITVNPGVVGGITGSKIWLGSDDDSVSGGSIEAHSNGHLYVRNRVKNRDLLLTIKDTNDAIKTAFYGAANGAGHLYWDGQQKFQTTEYGIRVSDDNSTILDIEDKDGVMGAAMNARVRFQDASSNNVGYMGFASSIGTMSVHSYDGQILIQAEDQSSIGKIYMRTSDYGGSAAYVLDATSEGVLMSQQCRFLAHTSTTLNNVTGDGTYYTVVFGVERYDTGANFASSTGVFTAPRAGKYLLKAGLRMSGITSDMDSVNLRITTSNMDYQRYSADTNDLAEHSYIDHSVVADMDAGDTAYVRVAISGGSKVVDIYGLSTSAQSIFCGHLLS
ncbi:MAG: hypothetical protein COB29_13975 [Sulfitobacter sp.]|nr:MAG: hypothetical protein COB29_13975 [Sulfitobacter sp.]